MHLSTRQLRAFLTLAQLGSFTRAAEALHLSQPAFSATIGALEQAVGARLFFRTTRHVELTAEGRVFEGSARRVVAELESAVADVRDQVERRRGKVAVAVLPSLAAGWLPPVLATFRAAHPGIEIQVADVLSEPALERVRSGRADFAIVTTAVDEGELDAEPFCSDRFELVCRRDHRLARSVRVTVADLAGERIVHQVRHSIVGRFLASALHPLPALPSMEVEQLATVIGMVRAGLGIAAIPQFNLHDFRYPDLVRRELDFAGLERHIHIVRPRARPLSSAAQALHALMLRQRPGGSTGDVGR